MSRQNRVTSPQIKVSHLSSDPPPRQAGAKRGGCRGGWWRVSRHFGFRKRIALQGGVAATSHQSHLSSATKSRGNPAKLFMFLCFCFPDDGRFPNSEGQEGGSKDREYDML